MISNISFPPPSFLLLLLLLQSQPIRSEYHKRNVYSQAPPSLSANQNCRGLSPSGGSDWAHNSHFIFCCRCCCLKVFIQFFSIIVFFFFFFSLYSFEMKESTSSATHRRPYNTPHPHLRSSGLLIQRGGGGEGGGGKDAKSREIKK